MREYAWRAIQRVAFGEKEFPTHAEMITLENSKGHTHTITVRTNCTWAVFFANVYEIYAALKVTLTISALG